MAPTASSRRPLLRPQPVRRGVIGSLIDEATGLIQTVANDVAPGVVGALDVDGLVQRLDIEAVLARVDLNAVLAQVDVNALLATIDIDQLMARIDANEILERVDVNALMERTDLAAIITRSGAGIATEAVDAARSAAVGLDSFVHRWVDRLLRRPAHGRPGEPGLPVPAMVPEPG